MAQGLSNFTAPPEVMVVALVFALVVALVTSRCGWRSVSIWYVNDPTMTEGSLLGWCNMPQIATVGALCLVCSI